MKVLLVGAGGTVGQGIDRLLKSEGWEVVAASRSTRPSLNIDDPVSIESFYKDLGKVDAVICAAGDAAFAAVQEVTDEQMALSLRSKLSGQVNLVRKGIPYLNANGVFVLTGGILAYEPIAKTSMISMVNAAIGGFVRGAAVDLEDGKRIVAVHPTWVKSTAEKVGIDPAPWPDSDETAKAYWTAVTEAKSGESVFVSGYEPVGKA